MARPLARQESETAVVETDGRRLRTEESRRRVVTALLQCVREGEFDPSAEAVALRAGVGLRTVFRLFKDKEGLFQQMSEAVHNQLAVLANAPLRGATWRERLEEVMKRRFTGFEQVMPYRQAAHIHAHYSAVVKANNEVTQLALRQVLAAVLAPEIVADRVSFEALELALHIDTWIRLRIDQNLRPAQARAVVVALAEAVLRRGGYMSADESL